MRVKWMLQFIVFVSLPVVIQSAIASETVKYERYRIENKLVQFVRFPDVRISISANCVSGKTIKNCEGHQALKRVNLGSLNEDLFGRNPGALLCSQQLGGTVVWTKDERGDERTFCKFSDGSFVGSGTLSFYARKNAKP